MKSIKEIESIIINHKPVLKDKYHVKTIGIFGSYARGDETENSDIDILVDFSEPIGLDFVGMALELEEILGIKVDLVSTGAIKPEMMKYIRNDLVNV